MEGQQRLRSVLICRICGGVARGMNFDVIRSMACKVFFGRNALRSKGTLRCKLRFHCEITKEDRTNCAACRLKKCFASAMRPQLLRCFAQQQLPTPQPLALLQDDRFNLTAEQWNLLSNILHTYDSHNPASVVKHLLEEELSLPVKLRAKP